MKLKRETLFDKERRHRFTLWREWEPEHAPLPLSLDPSPPESRPENQFVQFIGLNPSTADEIKDDPTIRRCRDFARRWGYNAFCMTNAFSLRSTNPRRLWQVSDPTHDCNVSWILTIAHHAALTVAAWGNHASFMPSIPVRIRNGMAEQKKKLFHLGLNEDGSPKHPLYLPAITQPILWKP